MQFSTVTILGFTRYRGELGLTSIRMIELVVAMSESLNQDLKAVCLLTGALDLLSLCFQSS